MNPPVSRDDDDFEGDTEPVEEGNAAQAAEQKTGGTKRKTKSQSEKDSNIDKIIKLAQVDDHPVELVLQAIAKQMIRTLSADEQDELLDEIQAVSSGYFRERRKKLKQKPEETGNSISIVRAALPPPPLTPAGQPVQHAEVQQLPVDDEVLVEVAALPPMEQYSNAVQYVSGGSFMKLLFHQIQYFEFI